MNRNSQSHFALNPTNISMSRSVFNRPFNHKFSFNVGRLIPFYCEEVLPGDTVELTTSKVVRLQPMVAPMMDQLFLDTYYFFVPTRLIWEHWINFNGENTTSPWVEATQYTTPQITIPTGGFNKNSIACHMGVPCYQGAGTTINVLPFRAYALICDQWFRSQALQTPLSIPMDETTVTGSNNDDQVTDIAKGGAPFIVCKTFDYFTGALPAPQKGPDVQIMFDSIVPVVPYKDLDTFATGSTFDKNTYDFLRYKALGTGTTVKAVTKGDMYTTADGVSHISTQTSSYSGGDGLVPTNLGVNLESSLFNVNQLREAFAVQRYYEKLARGGSRYIETIKAFYGVTSPDARLQRAEYLGGNRVFLNVNQVEQTSATEATLTPLGTLAGNSLTNDVNADFVKSFTEHGFLIGVTCVRYNHTYQNGLTKMWLRKDIETYYNPVFANIGEMPIRNDQIYLGTTAATNAGVFGYQEAWAEYRYSPNRVSGSMASNASDTLDMWHLADDYASLPSLSASWIREDHTNLDRVLAVTSTVTNQLFADFYVDAKWVRPMPLYSIPGLIDHN